MSNISKNVADDVIHKNWYFHDVSLQRTIVTIISTNKLECKLSIFQNIDLTLPSFITVYASVRYLLMLIA
ncbi:hypothetical protein E2986_12639 [Frieseomelitta varia]|uniref:Uncharacterized protein n=1 Tax=Frieseomelitta varia TaxID=561572 RepID=A0A833SB38_9HYME|nr:hypothetical protein E2986_12639 [Frieseomelitta varia]